MILWELLTRRCPYEGLTQFQVAVAVVRDAKRPELPPSAPGSFGGGGAGNSTCPKAYRDLVERCWAQDGSARPSFRSLLADGVLDHACKGHLPTRIAGR